MNNNISPEAFEDIHMKAGTMFTRRIREAYFSGQLKEFLDMVGMSDLYPEEEAPVWDGSYPTGKIVVVGKAAIGKDVVQGILKRMGFKDRYELYLEYDEFKNRNLKNKLQYNSIIRLILAGPMPHSIEGKGDDSSGVVMLENMDGFAKVVRLEESKGTLKITRTSLRKALQAEVDNGFLSVA